MQLTTTWREEDRGKLPGGRQLATAWPRGVRANSRCPPISSARRQPRGPAALRGEVGGDHVAASVGPGHDAGRRSRSRSSSGRSTRARSPPRSDRTGPSDASLGCRLRCAVPAHSAGRGLGGETFDTVEHDREEPVKLRECRCKTPSAQAPRGDRPGGPRVEAVGGCPRVRSARLAQQRVLYGWLSIEGPVPLPWTRVGQFAGRWLPPGANQSAFFRTTGLGSWARDVSRAVTARLSAWYRTLPTSSAALARTCGVRVGGPVPQRGVCSTWSAPGRRCRLCSGRPGQGLERGDPDPGVGTGHGDHLAHGVGVDQVVEEAAAAFADGRILVLEASTDRALRSLGRAAAARDRPPRHAAGRPGTRRAASLSVLTNPSMTSSRRAGSGESRHRAFRLGQPTPRLMHWLGQCHPGALTSSRRPSWRRAGGRRGLTTRCGEAARMQ